MLHLKADPTLADIQQYVREMEIERGFTKGSILEQCLQLGEEIGELFKAIRKQQNMRVDPNSTDYDVAGELADVLIYLSSIANRLQVDLEVALREKEEINKRRSWKRAEV